jgi:protein gp37
MGLSKIDWTDITWNPITGCSKISPGCANCYAKTMAHRLKAMGMQKYSNGFTPTIHMDSLTEPLKLKQPYNIFVCSMSDLFHESVSFSFIDKIMDTIIKTPQHYYQILTKRAKRMLNYFSNSVVPTNAWLGVTVEDNNAKTRIDFLRKINCSVHFISCEPLLEDLGTIDLTNINWMIVGGETGTNARKMKQEWVHSILQQTKNYDVAFFFKQWGLWGPDGIKRTKKANGNFINGKRFQMMPKVLQVNA